MHKHDEYGWIFMISCGRQDVHHGRFDARVLMYPSKWFREPFLHSRSTGWTSPTHWDSGCAEAPRCVKNLPSKHSCQSDTPLYRFQAEIGFRSLEWWIHNQLIESWDPRSIQVPDARIQVPDARISNKMASRWCWELMLHVWILGSTKLAMDHGYWIIWSIKNSDWVFLKSWGYP